MNDRIRRQLCIRHLQTELGLLRKRILLISTARADSPMNPACVEPDEPGLPASNMALDPQRVALAVIDPQNAFLTEKGVAWGVVEKSMMKHDDVGQHLKDLFKAAKSRDLTVFISSHASISA